MNARRCLVLAATVALLIAAAVGTLAALFAAGALTLTMLAVAAPAQPGTYRRRSTNAVPGAVHAPSRSGAGDGPYTTATTLTGGKS